MSTHNHSLKIPSVRTSFSSNQTFIEPEQQQQLGLQLNDPENVQVEQTNPQQIEPREERRTAQEEQDPEDEDHERRLRLIEVNRTQTRLFDEEPEPPSPLAFNPTSSPPPRTVLISDVQPHQHSKEEPLQTTIPLEILLSPINQKKAFHLDHLLTIAELINHLLNHWPSDWSQAGWTVPHHVNQFRMVYMGRFLDDQETLNSLGKIRPIIIHLVIKPDTGSTEEEEVVEDRVELCGCWGTFRGRSSRPANRQGTFGNCLIV